MKLIPINILSAVIFPFVFSACVSQSSVDFNKQQAAKARVELALGYLQQEDFVQAKLNLDKAFEHDDRYYLVHSALAHFYQLQGDTEKAKQAYLQAIKLDDKQGDVYKRQVNTIAKLTFHCCTFGSVDNIPRQLTTSGINIITTGFTHNHRKAVFH